MHMARASCNCSGRAVKVRMPLTFNGRQSCPKEDCSRRGWSWLSGQRPDKQPARESGVGRILIGLSRSGHVHYTLCTIPFNFCICYLRVPSSLVMVFPPTTLSYAAEKSSALTTHCSVCTSQAVVAATCCRVVLVS